MSSILVATAVLLVLGFALQLFLWSRQWIYGDQYALLTPAVQYLQGGELQPFSKGMSGGGRIPGTLLQRIIALPLQLWPDFRAPSLAMGLSQVVAVAILVLTLTAAQGRRFALFFVALYWLSPWRLYHAGFLWEPGFMFLPAALHLGCCWLLRSSPGDGPTTAADLGRQPTAVARVAASIGLGAVLVATPQIHASFLVLVAATGGLLVRRRIRPLPSGLAAGAILAGITLIPTFFALWNDEVDGMFPQLDRRVALPLLVLSNVGKAAAYWLRMGSADIGRRLRQTAWLSDTTAGTEAGLALPSTLVAIVAALTIASLLVAVLANVQYWRQRRRPAPRAGAPRSPREARAAWLGEYVLVMLIALLGVAALSPVPVQGWHMVIALHAACIPVAGWMREAFERSPAQRALVVAFVALLVATVILLGLGHEMYLRPDQEHVMRQDIPDYLRPLLPTADR